MARKQVVAVRLDQELLAWVDSYAKERQRSRTDLVQAALHSFRDEAQRGVPEIEQRSPVRVKSVRTTDDKSFSSLAAYRRHLQALEAAKGKPK